MTKWTIAALVFTIASVAPADGQTIVDTLHQLRGTISQLRPRTAVKAVPVGAPQATTAPSSGDRADGGLMVPANVISDDASESALERTPLVPHRVETFDIRGLKLGMSPREVGRIADRQQFRRRWNSLLLTSGTFEVEATRLANVRLDRPVDRTSKVQLKAVQGFDSSGDQLACEFTMEPGGPKLSRIEYTARLNGTTRTQAVEALVGKYGPRSKRLIPEDIGWTNSNRLIDNSSPDLIAVIGNDTITLTLTQSVDYVRDARKKLDDRATQIAAAHGAGVKF